MTDSPCPTELLDRWRGGDQQAATQLFELYSKKLLAMAERNLSHRLSRRVEGDDIVQSVFRTFFRRGEAGQFQIDNSTALWRLLVKITLAKVRTQARRHQTLKRDVAAEASSEFDEWVLHAAATDPGPQEASMLVEHIEKILQGLPAMHGEILALRLQGHSRTDIAGQLGVSRQTIYRVLTLLQQRLERILPDP